MYDITLSVVSPEEGFDGTCEFWSGGELIALTRYEDNDLVLHIEPRRDGSPRLIGVEALTAALAEATRLLAPY